MSQEHLARKVNIRSGYLSEIERGAKTPSTDLVQKMCDVLRIDAPDLLAEIVFEQAQRQLEQGESIESYPIRQVELTIRAVRGARQSLSILGINALRPAHEGRESMISLLDDGGTVRICILKRGSEGFRVRERHECYNKETKQLSPRLKEEYRAAVGILKDIEIFRKGGVLEVRQYIHYPVCSLVIADDKIVQYNPYTREKSAWDDTPAKLSRGLLNPLLVYTKRKGKEFDDLVELYETIWNGAERLEL